MERTRSARSHALVFASSIAVLCAACRGASPAPVASASPTFSAEESPSPSLTLEEPPLDEARLEGRYGSAAFFFGDDFTFDPRCDAGACDVTGTIRMASVDFRYRAGEYRGVQREELGCGPAGSLSSTLRITYTLHVVDADFIDDVWTATELSVSAITRAPPVFDPVTGIGCDGVNVRERDSGIRE